ncbi:MAG TPA: hypothetical protein VJ729_07665 [Nitrososphaeraceae archaeon]|nr:hypothetical protein [Nitrososphaeraceae archaeon]
MVGLYTWMQAAAPHPPPRFPLPLQASPPRHIQGLDPLNPNRQV